MATEPNPKAYVAASSGDNTFLAADANGRKYLLTAIQIIPTSSTPVSLYLHDGAGGNLLGSAAGKMTIDLLGASGHQGEVANFNPDGWCPPAASVVINLSAAVPVIVNASYRLR